MDISQAHLDRLHEIDFTVLHDPTLTPKQRTEILKVTRQKLKMAKQALGTSITEVKRRWDGRNRAEAVMEEVELMPLNLVGQMYAHAELYLAEVQSAISLGTSLPPVPRFGEYVVKSIDSARYAIVGDLRDKLQWQLDDVRQTGKQYNEVLKQGEASLKKQYQAQRLVAAMGLLISLVIIVLIMTIPNSPKLESLSTFVIIGLITAYMGYSAFQTGINATKATIDHTRNALLALKRDYHNLQTALIQGEKEKSRSLLRER